MLLRAWHTLCNTNERCALMKTFRTNKQKVIDRYSQVIYTAHSVMPFTIQHRTKFFTTRDCARKGGIVDGD